MSSKRRNIKNRKRVLPKGTMALNPRQIGATMYKSPRTIMPQTYTTNLSYLVDYVITSIGGAQASTKYRTDAYDVDPALASTAMPGFAEFAAFYSRFRTLKISYEFAVANQEAFTVMVIHGFSNTSIGATALNLQYAGNPTFKIASLGPATGNSSKTFKGSTSVVNMKGSQQPLFDDLYTGSTTSSTLATVANVYANCGFIAPAAFTALGVNVVSKITLQVQFYGLNFLLS